MRPKRNTAPPLGPDTCETAGCENLAQTRLSATGDTLRSLGFAPVEGERLSVRCCLACYLKAMAEVQARARKPAPAAPGGFTTTAATGKVGDVTGR